MFQNTQLTKILSGGCLVLFVSMVISCATLFTGTSDVVNVSTNPEGAKVYVDDAYKGTSPIEVSLKRNADHNVRVTKAGFQDASSILRREFNPVSLINTVFVLFWLVDIVTGALWKFEKDGIHITLEKSTQGAVSGNGNIAAGEDLKIFAYQNKTAIGREAQTTTKR
ncbi:MAG: PEGA domain-containing protein [Deltaproteobacteria bacterium]|nr:PEGA domain-containing protein [Deltaproteobacteria bacterium]